ncbi:peptide-methionine (S)-S-oxide reductase MsrA [Orrella marina]|uniref:Peptide methionine sulfoxide reductase MsrA n=1 Tax=Orrella marina TaxID=2163011 RepID=A0A2R4XKH6_9BURK|nr:peptide-methionine (S)-S-oxide reductase MsrA [Orrella marina]AWB34288.1 peptide-methionine (S)-S-oxide reductase [Orrella marina]
METAVFGGGCFWCTEAIFSAMKGVHSVRPGYCGGHVEAPSYDAVCAGTTGHIEVVAVEYDEKVVSFETMLDVFFGTHDPTTPGRQGHDVGPQYQSAVFAQNDMQHTMTEQKIRELDQQGVFPAKICTLILPPQKFWVAEDYHHDFFERNPGQGYCQVVVSPKVMKFRKNFYDYLK